MFSAFCSFPLWRFMLLWCIIIILSGRGTECRVLEFFFLIFVMLFREYNFFFHFLRSSLCSARSSSYFHQSEYISSSCNSSVTVTDIARARGCRQYIPYTYQNNSSRQWTLPHASNWSEALNYSFNMYIYFSFLSARWRQSAREPKNSSAFQNVLLVFVFTSNRNKSQAMKEAFKLCGRYTLKWALTYCIPTAQR